ncbi:MAG: PAS domain-containing protein, partial [Telluria sp.]
MSPSPSLAAEMQAAASEIYLLDADTLGVVDANQAARQNLGYDAAELQAMDVFALAPSLARATLVELLAGLGQEVGAQVSLRTRLRRAGDGSYPVRLSFLRIVRDGRALLLAIADDLTLEQAVAKALAQSQARFDAIVRNTPGLVYQFMLHPDGRPDFPWLSDGCQALLGLSVSELQRDATLFEALILPDDRKGYVETMAASRAALSSWNWEGRIWIDAWNDVKWINLRATPNVIDGGAVQWDGIMTNISASKQEQQEVMRSRSRLA